MPSRPKTSTLIAKPASLQYLAQPLTKSVVTQAMETEVMSREVTDQQAEDYDRIKTQKRLVVQSLESLRHALISPHVSTLDKAKLGLEILKQVDGSRKIIEWDRRVMSDKELLETAEKTERQIKRLRETVDPESIAEAEVGAAVIALKMVGDGKVENASTN